MYFFPTPYTINEVMPDVQLFDIPSGDWYFFSRMINQLATSNFSPASTVYNYLGKQQNEL